MRTDSFVVGGHVLLQGAIGFGFGIRGNCIYREASTGLVRGLEWDLQVVVLPLAALVRPRSVYLNGRVGCKLSHCDPCFAQD